MTTDVPLLSSYKVRPSFETIYNCAIKAPRKVYYLTSYFTMACLMKAQAFEKSLLSGGYNLKINSNQVEFVRRRLFHTLTAIKLFPGSTPCYILITQVVINCIGMHY